MMTIQSFGGVAAGQAVPLFPAAAKWGELLLLSGQAPLDPVTGRIVEGDFKVQAQQVISSVQASLAEAGAGMADVLRVVCILARAEDFAAWNEVFAEAFREPRPVRTTFVAGFVLPGMLLEIEVTACVNQGVAN